MKARPVVDIRALVAALETNPALRARVGRLLAPDVFAAGMTAAKRPTGTYSSRKGHGAPGLSEEQNKQIAERIGRRRGRWFVYTAEDLERYEREQRDGKPANNSPPAPALASAPKWHPADTLPSVRRRVVGGHGQ